MAAAFDAPVILRSGSDVCIDVFVQGGDSTESKLLCSAKVTAEDLLALNKQRSNTLQDFEESALSSSSSSSGLSSDSDCTDINVSEHDDDQCGQEQEHGVTAPAGRFYAVQDASMEAVVETYSISDSAAQEWDAECFSGSGATSDSDSEDESHNEPVQDLFEHALPAALQSTGSAQKQSGVSDVSNSSFSTSLKAGLSCRYNSVPLECISEESSVDNAEVCCGAVDSGASEAEVTFATDLHDASNKCTVGKVSLVFSLAAHSSAGIVDPPNGSQDRRSSNPRSSIMAATDSTPGLISAPEDRRASTASGESNEEDEGDNRQALVTVRAEGFSHFFRVTAAEFKEMEEYFRFFID